MIDFHIIYDGNSRGTNIVYVYKTRVIANICTWLCNSQLAGCPLYTFLVFFTCKLLQLHNAVGKQTLITANTFLLLLVVSRFWFQIEIQFKF